MSNQLLDSKIEVKIEVPYLDLKSQHASLRDEIEEAIREVIDASAFAGGPFVARFEAEFAEYCDCPYAIGLGSGTEALWLSLLALGIGPGDDVVTVPNSFMATAEAITYCGARPVFADVDENTYTMDPVALEKAITNRTKAIIPVHLFGQPADMDSILAVAREHGLAVVEDACQAHGAEYKGRKIGALSDAACFSFYPGKNLGAFGEGGAVVTRNAELDGKIRILRDHGQVRKYYHSMVGWNCRMDGIQGAVLRVKLRHLERFTELRRAHAAHYDQGLHGTKGLVTPSRAPRVRHVYHIYAIRVQDRHEVMQSMAKQGVGTGVHYPVPIHLQEAYQSLGYRRGSFPISERCATEFVSLPMFPELAHGQVEAVIRAVKNAVVGGKAI
ncbi:MAG: DegT/DnrJ/EryC1/StrS family aminotransferase [Verrucomicrobia bacterium]|nr:DegT/DnrJ/EryC1/StrS family aminotransferase [Verrucomicrobiota bacterium]